MGRILLITVLTAALAGALLYLVPAQTPSQSTVYPDGEVVETYAPSDYCYLPSRTGATVVCAVGLVGVMAVLSLNGCGYGTKTDLTMRRLRIGEGAANLWWMVLNAVCLLFYWAVMAAVTVLVLQLRIRNIAASTAVDVLQMTQVTLALVERTEQRDTLQMASLPALQHPRHALL